MGQRHERAVERFSSRVGLAGRVRWRGGRADTVSGTDRGTRRATGRILP